jgi:hypothetical protein
MIVSTKNNENKIKPIAEQDSTLDVWVPAQAKDEKLEVERRIAQMEAMQKFQLIAKKRSRPFWKKMLSIK